MKFQRKKVATALACALSLSGTALLAANALAADIKVDVTGSNIPRTEGESALPITVITREDINRAGTTTVYDLLQLVSANTSAGNISVGNVIGATTFSAQTASLRALGGGRTLVLLNGKRLNSFAGEIQGVQGVNLDAIPLSAIERIEVLKDGASAIYGSDAIAGVINFILRSDYQGAEVTGYYGTPTRDQAGSHGDVWNGKLSAGWGDLAKDRFNVFITGSYEDRKPLLQSERNFSRTSYIPSEGVNTTSGNTFPGFISTGGIGSPDFPNCGAIPGSIRIGSRCRFDPAQYFNVESLPEQKLTNIFGSARYQINANTQAYAQATYSNVETHFIIQPVPISDQFFYGPNGDIPASILLPPSSPFYPTAAAIAAGVNGRPLNVRYRCVLCGNRDTTDTNEAWQGVLGLKGMAWNWDYDVAGIWNEGKITDHLNGGFPLYSRVLPLLSSGTVNLFGPNSDAIAQQVAATNFIGDTFHGKSTNKGIQGKASREIWNLPAGPLAFAFGGEYRRETLDQNPNPVLATGDVSGFGGNILAVNRSRNSYAGFVEFNVPILRTLEGNAAVRYDHYSDFGSTTNPKFSLRWQPMRQVVLRTSYGTGFLAPSLYQLWTPNISGVTNPGLTDPIRCPVTADSLDCDTQFPVTFGGNPNLKPERSEQITAGIVLEPIPRGSISIDYFRLRLADAITNGISPDVILSDLGQFGFLVTRAPGAGNLPGRIINIDQRYVNLGGIHVRGLDVDARYATEPAPWGRLKFGITGTYYIKYDQQQTDLTWAGFVSNQLGSATSGVIPRWKHYATIGWDLGPWAFTVAESYQSSYIDVNTDVNGNLRRVSSQELWDLQASYTGFRNITLTAGVRNVFDRNPPFSNQNTTFQVGYDPSYYDPRARFVYGSITWKFL